MVKTSNYSIKEQRYISIIDFLAEKVNDFFDFSADTVNKAFLQAGTGSRVGLARKNSLILW